MILPRTLLAQIHSHLEAGYPHEACGIMLGRGGVVTEIVAATNTRTDSARNRYLIDPLQFKAVQLDADKRRLDVLGIYHSHPDVAARPSSFDLENATWPGYSYLIVSVVKGNAVETTSWQLRDDRSQFDPEPVEIPD